MVTKIIVLGATACALTGCFQANTSQSPLPATYPVTQQQKMQAAHHWDVLAEHEAKLITGSLGAANIPLHVNGGDASQIFYKGYTNLLTSQLVQNGATVLTTPGGAAQVSFDVDVVKHTDKDSTRSPAGSWTLLTAGVAVAAHAVDKWSTPAKLLIPAAVGADIFSGNWVKESNVEVIITTKVTNQNRILHSSSNIYYINGGDASHYLPKPATSKTIKMTSQER